MLTQIIFAITLVCEAIILVSLLFSIFVPARRVWPPPGRETWQFRLTWSMYTIAMLGSLALGVLDWNHGAFDTSLRFLIGALLIVGGLGFATWAIRTLSWHQSMGLKGRFVTDGPYQVSRNPQYVGDSLALLGYAIFTNSPLTLLVNLIGILTFVLTPFSEEPWLRQQFGSEYEEFLTQIPRYFSLKNLSNK